MLFKIVSTTTLTAVLALRFATTDAVAEPSRHETRHPPIDDASPAYGLVPHSYYYTFVPGRGISNEACNLPTSTCANEQRDD